MRVSQSLAQASSFEVGHFIEIISSYIYVMPLMECRSQHIIVSNNSNILHSSPRVHINFSTIFSNLFICLNRYNNSTSKCSSLRVVQEHQSHKARTQCTVCHRYCTMYDNLNANSKLFLFLFFFFLFLWSKSNCNVKCDAMMFSRKRTWQPCRR